MLTDTCAHRAVPLHKCIYVHVFRHLAARVRLNSSAWIGRLIWAFVGRVIGYLFIFIFLTLFVYEHVSFLFGSFVRSFSFFLWKKKKNWPVFISVFCFYNLFSYEKQQTHIYFFFSQPIILELTPLFKHNLCTSFLQANLSFDLDISQTYWGWEINRFWHKSDKYFAYSAPFWTFAFFQLLWPANLKHNLVYTRYLWNHLS